MKVFISIIIVASACFIFLNQEDVSIYKPRIAADKNREIPVPAQVYEHMADEEGFGEKKRAYFDLIHGNNPGIDWRAINDENFRNIAAKRIEKRKNKTPEIFANGEINAEWFERGSNNNAGSVRITDYDAVTDNVYAISDGGTMWKGTIAGTTWSPLNEDLQFGSRILKTFYLPGGAFRIVAAIGHSLFYSDDEGITWTQSTGFTADTDYGTGVDLVMLNDASQTLVYVYQGYDFGLVEWENRLAFSTDNGTTFTHVIDFNTASSNFVSMAMPYGSATAYIINGNNDTYKFEGGSLIPISTGLSLNGTASVKIAANMTITDTTIYVLVGNEELYKSTDNAASFIPVSTLPVPTWGVGMQVSIDNPDILYFGEMELYRSTDGGTNWNFVSEWWEYYSDVQNKIHADIMDISTYKNSNGDEFTLISNHGGISVSYDNLQTTQNLGTLDLNVGQFYDVMTSPNPLMDPYIFGGTQDQGFQIGDAGTTSTSNFLQLISGDYGQMQFSRDGIGVWIQYPGADFSYYENITSAPLSTFSVNINGNDMPNVDWIVPTGAPANPADDYILAGGGNLSGGSGSYLIKIENSFGSPSTYQYNFNFLAASGAKISAIETTPLDENKWYVATENGKFFHSENAGMNWTQTTSFTGPENDWIYSADVYASRLTPGLVFVGGSGYTTDAVHMSVNGGNSFVPISSGLPPTMVHELCMDPAEKFLFAATDAGPFVYVMADGTWYDLLGLGAPVQEYMSVEFVESTHLVRFATWGRGIWDFKMTQVAGTNEIVSSINSSVYPNPSANGDVTIRVEKNSALIIYNLQGQEVSRNILNAGKNSFNLSHLKSGTYIFVMADENGNFTKEKWVMQ